MCGEMAGDPINLPILLGLGVEELSMNPQAIPSVKNMIKLINLNDSRLFINEVLKQKTTQKVIELLDDTYGSIISDNVKKW